MLQVTPQGWGWSATMKNSLNFCSPVFILGWDSSLAVCLVWLLLFVGLILMRNSSRYCVKPRVKRKWSSALIRVKINCLRYMIIARLCASCIGRLAKNASLKHSPEMTTISASFFQSFLERHYVALSLSHCWWKHVSSSDKHIENALC